ncbi:hypothetical protein MCOR25_007661 [Pyricularia grisea]|nr:hypothetical protein MCOR25_007661 [Pyricularia grisea]
MSIVHESSPELERFTEKPSFESDGMLSQELGHGHSDHSRRFVRSKFWTAFHWLKWLLFLLLIASALFVLLRQPPRPLQVGDDIYGALPKVSYEQVIFEDQVENYTPNFTSEAQSREVLERWRSLVPMGSGNVNIGDLDQYPDTIPQPFKINGFGQLYMVSWVNQMKCLYDIMNAYDVLVRLGPTGSEGLPTKGRAHPRTRQCFDYLRQAIMCHGDMTLEGASGQGPPRGSDGYGAKHICRNRAESFEWIGAHRPFDDQDVLGDS